MMDGLDSGWVSEGSMDGQLNSTRDSGCVRVSIGNRGG